jgi:predicted enzyme related to lactoylglutathione lyase
MTNAISWFQIPVINFERAVKFYSTVLSGEFTKTKTMGAEVAIFPYDRETDAVGGALYCGPGFVPGTNGSTVLLNAGDDLTVVLSKIEMAGGKIIFQKTPINKGSGFVAFFIDTEGNRIGLHSKN